MKAMNHDDQLVRRFFAITQQGCEVRTERTLDRRSGFRTENIELSHPRPLSEVAFTHETLIERAWRLGR